MQRGHAARSAELSGLTLTLLARSRCNNKYRELDQVHRIQNQTAKQGSGRSITCACRGVQSALQRRPQKETRTARSAYGTRRNSGDFEQEQTGTKSWITFAGEKREKTLGIFELRHLPIFNGTCRERLCLFISLDCIGRLSCLSAFACQPI